jgi:hypothetical protein
MRARGTAEREMSAHSKGAITSPARQLTKCALAIKTGVSISCVRVCTFSVALGTCPCRQPQDLFLSLAGGQQLGKYITHSIALLHSGYCMGVRLSPGGVWASLCLYIIYSLHGRQCVWNWIWISTYASQSDDPALCATADADLSARDLQQQFLCVHAAWTRGFSCRHLV